MSGVCKCCTMCVTSGEVHTAQLKGNVRLVGQCVAVFCCICFFFFVLGNTPKNSVLPREENNAEKAYPLCLFSAFGCTHCFCLGHVFFKGGEEEMTKTMYVSKVEEEQSCHLGCLVSFRFHVNGRLDLTFEASSAVQSNLRSGHHVNGFVLQDGCLLLWWWCWWFRFNDSDFLPQSLIGFISESELLKLCHSFWWKNMRVWKYVNETLSFFF